MLLIYSVIVIIEVKKLQKTYGTNTVVKGINFEVKNNEIFGILGPNGAGKTTTLEMIEAMRTIDSGSIKIDGIDVSRDPQKVKQRIGIQLQSSAFMELLNLKELLQMFAASFGVTINPIEILDTVQLQDKSNSEFMTLSGGQKQRFSIACAMVHQPKILFLDEPTTGLDPQARLNLWELIRSVRKSGVTIILTTHYMEEASKLCDRVAIMDDGKIVALDTPQKLITQLLKRGFKKRQEVEKANLEDVFIDLTGKDLRE